mmetsp:Transcript_23257/g.76485  ORF Transcript_23257/g.76485 Transcript_23257/m.76485 type:complete len:373 (-) Transcript_23257:60-1178(-)
MPPRSIRAVKSGVCLGPVSVAEPLQLGFLLLLAHCQLRAAPAAGEEFLQEHVRLVDSLLRASQVDDVAFDGDASAGVRLQLADSGAASANDDSFLLCLDRHLAPAAPAARSRLASGLGAQWHRQWWCGLLSLRLGPSLRRGAVSLVLLRLQRRERRQRVNRRQRLHLPLHLRLRGRRLLAARRVQPVAPRPVGGDLHLPLEPAAARVARHKGRVVEGCDRVRRVGSPPEVDDGALASPRVGAGAARQEVNALDRARPLEEALYLSPGRPPVKLTHKDCVRHRLSDWRGQLLAAVDKLAPLAVAAVAPLEVRAELLGAAVCRRRARRRRRRLHHPQCSPSGSSHAQLSSVPSSHRGAHLSGPCRRVPTADGSL